MGLLQRCFGLFGPDACDQRVLEDADEQLAVEQETQPAEHLLLGDAGLTCQASRVRAARDSLKGMGELPEVVRGHETDLSGRGLAFHLLSSLDRGQHIRIAGQEPAAVGLFAVDRHTITGKPIFLSAGVGTR